MDIATLGVLASIATLVGVFLWSLHKILTVVKQTALSNEKLELRVAKLEGNISDVNEKLYDKIEKLTDNISNVNKAVGKLEGVVSMLIERENN
jgi:hypothetical protein